MKVTFFANEIINPASGVGKKIQAQVKAIKNLHGSCQFITISNEAGYFYRVVDNVRVKCFGRGFFAYIKAIYDYSCINDALKRFDTDIFFIRYSHFSSPTFLLFLKHLKKIGIKVYLEVPTYPYDNEYVGVSLKRRIKHLVDVCFRKLCFGFVDKVITYTDEDQIFGVDTIKISNAVSLEDIPLSKTPLGADYHFIAVANLAFWHGYDRFIESLAKFYNEKSSLSVSYNIFFHVVGDGDELQKLKQLAKNLNVEKYVLFYGELSGKELDDVFDKCHIGVDSLARHRSGNNSNNSLKSKEYIVRGLPILKSHFDPSLEGLDIYYQVSSYEGFFSLPCSISFLMPNLDKKAYIRATYSKFFSWECQVSKIFHV